MGLVGLVKVKDFAKKIKMEDVRINCHDFTLLAMFLALFFPLFAASSRVTQSHAATKHQKHNIADTPLVLTTTRRGGYLQTTWPGQPYDELQGSPTTHPPTHLLEDHPMKDLQLDHPSNPQHTLGQALQLQW
jgi:hypothetical protein